MILFRVEVTHEEVAADRDVAEVDHEAEADQVVVEVDRDAAEAVPDAVVVDQVAVEAGRDEAEADLGQNAVEVVHDHARGN